MPRIGRARALTFDNPYKSPNNACVETGARSHIFDRRLVFLLLPPLIPLFVHSVVRIFIPGDEALSHGVFALGAVVIAWGWTSTMVERLRWPFWKMYLVACAVYAAVVASAFLAPEILNLLYIGL